jgi:hypothetical protein
MLGGPSLALNNPLDNKYCGNTPKKDPVNSGNATRTRMRLIQLYPTPDNPGTALPSVECVCQPLALDRSF